MKLKGFVFQSKNKHGITRECNVICNTILAAAGAAMFVLQNKTVDCIRTFEEDTNKYETGFDHMPKHIESNYAQKQYNKGAEMVDEGIRRVYLRQSGAWSAEDKNGAKIITSYETIGLHANTKQVLEGFYNAGLPIVDYRTPLNIFSKP